MNQPWHSVTGTLDSIYNTPDADTVKVKKLNCDLWMVDIGISTLSGAP